MIRTSSASGLSQPTRPDLAPIERAEQLRLQLARQLADLVEEQRAAVGLLNAPSRRSIGAGERAALVAEQLGLDQRWRSQRAAIEHDERPGRARPRFVECLRGEILADARSRRAAAP